MFLLCPMGLRWLFPFNVFLSFFPHVTSHVINQSVNLTEYYGAFCALNLTRSNLGATPTLFLADRNTSAAPIFEPCVRFGIAMAPKPTLTPPPSRPPTHTHFADMSPSNCVWHGCKVRNFGDGDDITCGVEVLTWFSLAHLPSLLLLLARLMFLLRYFHLSDPPRLLLYNQTKSIAIHSILLPSSCSSRSMSTNWIRRSRPGPLLT